MKKIHIILIALLTIFVSACKDSNGDYSDVIYITGTLDANSIRMPFEGITSMGLTASSTAKVDQSVNCTFVEAPELLDAYNESTGKAFIMPPSGAYALENPNVTIEAGQFMSTQAKVSILDPTKFEEGKNYCLPVKLQSEGKTLESASTAYIVFVPIITTQVADISGTYYTVPKFRLNEDVGHFEQLTMECKVYVNRFQSASPYISTLMGLEENFLLRFGDVSCDKDQLQLAGGITGGQWDDPNNGGQKHPVTYSMHFQTGKWYHFAIVYNGSNITLYIDGKQVDDPVSATGTVTLAWGYLSSAPNSIGPYAIGMSAGSRLLNGSVSEFRVWSVARTQGELEENICYVDPTTPGLVAYWRFSGDDLQADGTVRDYTGHGYDAVPSGTAKWVENHKCPY